jgi:arginyl-tRNA--protein-N-Asp/Glu arginylyltransferase
MRFPSYRYPPQRGFKGKNLDNYLAKGFYRWQHQLFTLNFNYIGMKGMPVFWLRTRVADVEEGSTGKAIRKACKSFTVTYKEAEITDEINDLFREYSGMIDFVTSPTCAAYLHDNGIALPFNSMMFEIRDNDRLIAVGYFDKGTNAIAAILHFYHPDYKKYSLGKYLILKEIDYAAENKIPLYYSGYIAINYPKFDYKLFPDINAIEVFLPIEKEWKPYKQYDKVYLGKYFTEHVDELL